MFKGEEFVTFERNVTEQQLVQDIHSALSSLGEAHIDRSGHITIDPRSKFNGFLSTTSMEGYLRHREGKHTVSLEYRSTLSIFGWLILIVGLLFLLLGLLVLLAPMAAKNEAERSVKRALQELA